jgi:hypothetical protein
MFQDGHREVEDPYPQCATCTCIEDCPHPDAEADMILSLPLPPDVCPRPMDILRTKRKDRRKKNENNG